MKTNLRHLLFCAALAGLLPLTLAAQTDNPAANDKSAPAAATPAASAPAASTSASTTAVSSTDNSTAAPSAAAPVAAEPAATASATSTEATSTASAISTATETTAAASAPVTEPAAKSAEPSSGEAPLRRLDAPSAPETPAAAPAAPSAPHRSKARRSSGNNDRVGIGMDSFLGKDEVADSVVSVGGNATSEGDVADSVVAVAGNARATGPVRDAVVAVMGNAYVDSEVGQVVAVFGNVDLGPNAEVRGDVVTVFGVLHRDPNAKIYGHVQPVSFGPIGGHIEWAQTYVKECLMKGRPLAIAPHLGWAWCIALGFVVLYLLLAFLFGGALEKTVGTLETRPGGSILAAVLTLLLTPVLIILLCVTVVGIAVVPFLAIGLMCASLFGKAVMLCWLGRRITRLFGNGTLSHPAFAVLIGGIIILALYLVPFVGFIVYKLLGFLGLGVVVYTIILANKREKPTRPAVTPVAAQTPPATPPMGEPGAVAFAAAGVGTMGAAVPAAVSPVAVAALARAGFWLRVGALLIDVILVGIVSAVSRGLLPGFLHVHFPGFLVLLAIYGAILWKLRGTTIGGIICGLRVVRTDGRELDWATVIVRALGCFLSLFVVGLGFIWIAIDDEKQSWHDKIAGTVVVESRGTTLV